MIGITFTFMFHTFFSGKMQVLIALFVFFDFHSVMSTMTTSTIRLVLSFFSLIFHLVWSSGLDEMICLYLKIPLNFVFESSGLILCCAYTIWQYGQIIISCTIPTGSSTPPNHIYSYALFALGSITRGCRIYRLHLYRKVRLPNECPGYDTQLSDGDVPVMLKLWRMRSTPLLPSLPGPR